MVIVPKKTKFKKYRKFKSMFFRVENRYIVPKVGILAIKLIGTGRIKNNQLEAARKVCKRKLKRKFKKEIPHFSVFSDIVVTKKSSGVRMGKGKGSLNYWASFVASGRVLIELSSLVDKNSGSSILLSASRKLPYKYKFVF